MPSPKPAVIVRREFEFTPEVVTQQLRACIVGPACQLVRFNKAAEKSKGFVATVSSQLSENLVNQDSISAKKFLSSDTAYAIPSLAVSSVLDAPSLRVFVEDAYLTYADFGQTGSNTFMADSWASSVSINYLTLKSSNGTWKGASRNSSIAQDPAVGDIVQLYSFTSGASALVATTKVAGFTPDITDATFTAIPEKWAAALTSSGSTSSYPVTDLTGIPANGLTATLTNAFNDEQKLAYDPRKFGSTLSAYYIKILGYNGTTLQVSITTSIGNESLLNASATANGGVYTFTMPSGLTISITPGTNTLIVGSQAYVVVTMAHTPYTYNSTPGVGAITVALKASGGQAALNTLPKNTTYYLTCISGGSVKTAEGATFRVSTNNGADSVSLITVNNLSLTASGTYDLGSFGLEFKVGAIAANTYAAGFVKGDSFTFSATAATEGLIKKLVLADPYNGSAAIRRVRLSKQKTVEVSPFQGNNVTRNWTVTNPQDAELRRVLIEDSVIISDSSINSGTTPVSITAGKVYFEYKAFLALPREIGSVLTLSDITAQLGVIDPENPLAYATFKAWSNANGTTVHYIPVVNPTLNGERGFADALALAKGQRNCYSLVPLSTNPEVWNAFVAHANDESAPSAGRYRIVWIAPEIERHYKVQDSPVGNAGSIIPGTSTLLTTGKYTVSVPLDVASKFTETTRAGDWVRTDFGVDSYGRETFKEYRISSVIDNNNLVIVSASNPNLLSAQMEIFRDLTPAETAAEYVKVAGGFSSERVFAIVPNRGVNGLRVDGVPVKNWYVAAAFAGLRAGSRPHQPLSNVELLGFDGPNATVPAFNETDLDTLRDGGIWVVINNNEGKIYAERQLSTSTLDNFRKEQSVTCNIDSISFALSDGLKNLVGRVNITDKNINVVRGAITNILNDFTSAVGAETIGAQLRGYLISSITVPTTANDTVRARVVVTVPLPMNVIDITLVV